MPDTDNGYKNNIDICLLGPTQVGKTSLLATMYHTMKHDLPPAFSFEPLEPRVFETLTNAYVGLEKVALTAPRHIVRKSIEGNIQLQEYAFGLNFVDRKGRKEKLAKVTFYDPPGAWLGGVKGVDGHISGVKPELCQRLADSAVIVNVVDAGVLMEANPVNAEKYNGYARVHYLLDGLFELDRRNRVVLFVLTKAETWIADAPEALRHRFDDQHGKALRLFPAGAKNRVAVYLPVETLGNCRFSHTRLTEEGDEVIQYKRDGDKRFAPRLVHMPLLYALKFTLAELDRRRWKISKLFGRLFGNYGQLIKAMEAFDPKAEADAHAKFHGNEKLFDA